MTRAWAICWREFAAFFRVPLGWVVIALFVCLSSVFFTRSTLIPGEPASMREFFGVWWGLLIVICPAVSMRLFSEELRAGTIESVMTAPIGETAFVAGKFMAGMLFLLAMLLPSLSYVILLAALGRPDFGPILSGYIGLTLLGALYLSVGCLASSLTSSQTLAFLATMFALLALDILPRQVSTLLPDRIAHLVGSISPSLRLADFSRGLINVPHAAYFVLLTVWFLALCIVFMQSRRWR